MRPTTNGLSASMRAECADILNLTASIDQRAALQPLRRTVRAALSLVTPYALSGAVPALEEDYSDLSPNPPEDPTAWRGAQFRRLRNAAMAAGADSPGSGYAGHGRGAPE